MIESAQPLADSIPAAAARLGISRSSCYLEIKAQRLEALKARGRTIIARSEQERWLASLPRCVAA